MWGHGRVDEEEGSIIDAIVGIPAYTLSMAGLIGLPKDYMMQISARGSAFRPTIDWFRCCISPQSHRLLHYPNLGMLSSALLLCDCLRKSLPDCMLSVIPSFKEDMQLAQNCRRSS